MTTDPKTVAFFHAHPDDEAIFTAGTMARLAADGHHVVLVMATGGEHGVGASDCGVGFDRSAVGAIRRSETDRAAAILGIGTVIACGFEDSGLDGENPAGLAHQRTGRAADRVARLLDASGIRPEVWVTYDERGIYGHPDHIQVNRVGTRAAELAGVERVYWATMNRTRILAQMAENPTLRDEIDPDDDPMDMNTFGMPEEDITHAVDVSAHVATKRAAMAAHASQIAPDAFFLAMPDEVFAGAFGTEWFVDPNRPRAGRAFGADLFDCS